MVSQTQWVQWVLVARKSQDQMQGVDRVMCFQIVLLIPFLPEKKSRKHVTYVNQVLAASERARMVTIQLGRSVTSFWQM